MSCHLRNLLHTMIFIIIKEILDRRKLAIIFRIENSILCGERRVQVVYKLTVCSAIIRCRCRNRNVELGILCRINPVLSNVVCSRLHVVLLGNLGNAACQSHGNLVSTRFIAEYYGVSNVTIAMQPHFISRNSPLQDIGSLRLIAYLFHPFYLTYVVNIGLVFNSGSGRFSFSMDSPIAIFCLLHFIVTCVYKFLRVIGEEFREYSIERSMVIAKLVVELNVCLLDGSALALICAFKFKCLCHGNLMLARNSISLLHPLNLDVGNFHNLVVRLIRQSGTDNRGTTDGCQLRILRSSIIIYLRFYYRASQGDEVCLICLLLSKLIVLYNLIRNLQVVLLKSVGKTDILMRCTTFVVKLNRVIQVELFLVVQAEVNILTLVTWCLVRRCNIPYLFIGNNISGGYTLTCISILSLNTICNIGATEVPVNQSILFTT